MSPPAPRKADAPPPDRRAGIVYNNAGISTCTSVTATTSAGLLLAANTARKAAIFCNTSATVAVSIGSVGLTAGQGVTLAPGAAYVDSDSGAPWYGVAASGTAVVGVTEIS